MSLVSPSQSSPGGEITAAAINTPVNQLAAVVNGGIDSTNIAASGVGTTQLASNGVTAEKLATSAITLGYAQITSGFNSTTLGDVLVTGLTASVTIPSGGRRIKVTVFCRTIENTGGSEFTGVSIWDGTVGSGTRIGRGYKQGGAGVATIIAVVTPPAGVKTYNVGINVSGGTGSISAVANEPSFILVEAI